MTNSQSQPTICQSCGMPMKEAELFGTNSDGTRNAEYCRFCFQNGGFVDEGISLEGKLAKNIAIAKQMGMPESQAVELANTIIPNLKRWKR